MKKLDYLKLAFANNLFHYRAWIITVFSVTRPREDTEKYYLKLMPRPWGYAYIDENGQEQSISDSKAGEPLFKFADRVNIDSTWAANCAQPVETSVGNLLFNHFCILSAFGPKFPFVLGRTSVGKLEDVIAPKLQDTPEKESDRSNTFYYVDEYVKFVDALQDYSSLSQLASISATRQGVLPPTGIKEFKKGLLEKYKGKLEDPVELSKFEKELLAFDDNYLKTDPAYGKFLSGKITNTARKKLFLTMGNEHDFEESLKANPVTNSLNEGWPTDPKQFTYMMNGLRVGSFARGAETVKGGVSAKYLLRSANNFKIVDRDCGTNLGVARKFDDSNKDQLVGRYVVQSGVSTMVENKDQVGNYLGKALRVRSPMYCKLAGDNICKICAGYRLSQFPTGLTIPLTEISAIILTASLKKMHTSGTSTAKLKLAESVS